MRIFSGFLFCLALSAQYIPPAGGGSGTVTSVTTTTPISGGPITTTGAISCPTCTTNAAPLTNTAIVTGVSGNGAQASPATINQSTGLITTPGGVTAGNSSGNSGYLSFSGATSGANGFAVPNIAGASILYLLPATAGSTGQYLQDTGSATCPTLPSGAPSTCHQMAWATVTQGALTQISQQVLSGSASTVTFSAIPGTYTNLRIQVLARLTGVSSSDCYMQANGDTGTNYNRQYNFSNSGSVSGGNQSAAAQVVVFSGPGTGATHAGSAVIATIVIGNYAQTNFYKVATSLSGSDLTNFNVTSVFWEWMNTAAITSITFGPISGGSFAAGSIFTLYGEQ